MTSRQRLMGKVCIVTGAAQGFGAGIARLFAAEGGKVVIADINGDGARQMAAEIGKNTLAYQLDVSNGAEMQAMVQYCIKSFAKCDIMVNNAATTHRNQPMLKVDEALFERIFQVNVKSIYHSAQACVPVFRQQSKGVFLNIASTAALRPRPGLVWYNGSKGAVLTLTKSMAIELAEDNIRVNALCPVAGDTPLLKEFMGEDTEEMRTKFKASIPLGRLSTPADIAQAALYLVSDEAEFLTGVCLEVDGGRCI